MEYKFKSVADEIRQWIEASSKETGAQVSTLSADEGADVVRMIFEHFVSDDSSWWWEKLRLPSTYFDRNAVKISEILPTLGGEVNLIPADPVHDYPVYKLRSADLERVLDNCPLFEYSVVSTDGSWFLAESHHDVIFLCQWP